MALPPAHFLSPFVGFQKKALDKGKGPIVKVRGSCSKKKTVVTHCKLGLGRAQHFGVTYASMEEGNEIH